MTERIGKVELNKSLTLTKVPSLEPNIAADELQPSALPLSPSHQDSLPVDSLVGDAPRLLRVNDQALANQSPRVCVLWLMHHRASSAAARAFVVEVLYVILHLCGSSESHHCPSCSHCYYLRLPSRLIIHSIERSIIEPPDRGLYLCISNGFCLASDPNFGPHGKKLWRRNFPKIQKGSRYSKGAKF